MLLVCLLFSTGVDSMVLLHVMEALFQQGTFGVAHVNHNLREASDDEAAFLKDIVKRAGFHIMNEFGKIRQKNGIETAARVFSL